MTATAKPALVLHTVVPDRIIADHATRTDALVPESSVVSGSVVPGAAAPHTAHLDASLDTLVDNGSNLSEVFRASVSANCGKCAVDAHAAMFTVAKPVLADTSPCNVDVVVSKSLEMGNSCVTAVDGCAESLASTETPVTQNILAWTKSRGKDSAVVGLASSGAPIEFATANSTEPEAQVAPSRLSPVCASSTVCCTTSLAGTPPVPSAACAEQTANAHSRTTALGLPHNDNGCGAVSAAIISKTVTSVPEADEDTSVAAQMAEASEDEGIYRVDKVLDVRQTADGKREFLIKWKGWGHRWNGWEPEEHILDRRLLRKFNNKRPMQPKPVSEPLQQNIEVQLHSKRRCAKAGALKARCIAKAEDDGTECNEGDDDC